MFNKMKTYVDVRSIIFAMLIYGIYDAVYLFADTKRLVMDISLINTSILPKVILYLDLPIMVMCLLLAFGFDRKLLIRSLSIQSKKQFVWMVIGVVIFVVALWRLAPERTIDIYRVLKGLLLVGLLEEILFRGLIFNWLDDKMDDKIAMLLSGMLGGALYAVRVLAVSGSSVSWLFVLIFLHGIAGTIAAFIYKKTNSLWLLVYMHAATELM